MGVMHAGRIATNQTLQRLLSYLQHSGMMGATSVELMQELNLVAPATWVSMLRKNGIEVNCKYEGTTASKRKVFRYRLGASS